MSSQNNLTVQKFLAVLALMIMGIITLFFGAYTWFAISLYFWPPTCGPNSVFCFHSASASITTLILLGFIGLLIFDAYVTYKIIRYLKINQKQSGGQ